MRRARMPRCRTPNRPSWRVPHIGPLRGKNE